ncbi:MAG: hypothetical protein QGG64_05980, partial [Candidatus Latescibacteria bacterium]|nr:hypothetical protein [Candidatus Latescibacterota bacterium]
ELHTGHTRQQDKTMYKQRFSTNISSYIFQIYCVVISKLLVGVSSAGRESPVGIGSALQDI